MYEPSDVCVGKEKWKMVCEDLDGDFEGVGEILEHIENSENGGDEENLENFLDSDYDMSEESENDDDLFDKHVFNDLQIIEDFDSTKSSSDDDVVFIDKDLDENKCSDGEQDIPKYPTFNPIMIFDPDFVLGMIFSSREEFKKAVQSHAIRVKRSLMFSKIAPIDHSVGSYLMPIQHSEELLTSEVCDYEIPTQESRVEQGIKTSKVPGPRMWDQLMQIKSNPTRPG